MNLPLEIILTFGQYLYPADLASCVRVNKTWSEVLIPSLYRIIDESDPKKSRPSKDVLIRCGHHIRTLTLSRDMGRFGLYCRQRNEVLCPNLLRLHTPLRDRGPEEDSDCIWREAPKLLLNPRLLSLTVYGDAFTHFTWGAILVQTCPALHELLIIYASLDKDETEHLFTLGPQLSKLKLDNCHLTLTESMNLVIGGPGGPSGPRFPNLKHLYIEENSLGVLGMDLFPNCPALESLEGRGFEFDHGYNYIETSTFCKYLRSQLWSQLHSLSLEGVNDKQAHHILDACAPLSKIDFNNSNLSYRFLWALERHYESLEHLNLEGCYSMASWMLQLILTSAPKMITFKSINLNAFELADDAAAEKCRRDEFQDEFGGQSNEDHDDHFDHYDHYDHDDHDDENSQDVNEEEEEAETQEDDNESETEDELQIRSAKAHFADHDPTVIHPWACLELRSLTTCIQNVREGWDRQVYEQLSKLTQLRELNFSPDSWAARKPKGEALSFRLQSSGFEQLGSLRHLETLYLHELTYGIGALLWIRERWPKIHLVMFLQTPPRTRGFGRDMESLCAQQ